MFKCSQNTFENKVPSKSIVEIFIDVPNKAFQRNFIGERHRSAT